MMLINISFTTLLLVNLARVACWKVKDVINMEARHGNRKEVVAFSTSHANYKLYDWSKITTLITCNYHDSELIAFAHSKNVLVSSLADFPRSILVNETQIDLWVADQVNCTVTQHLDGVNVDFEEDIPLADVKSRNGLTSLMRKLSSKLKAVHPTAQVTIDFTSSPICSKSRCYDYKSITEFVDFAFIMAYDEWGQRSLAWANSPINVTTKGVKQFLALGIPSNKLVLGLPWYGYDYLCTSYSAKDKKCLCKSHHSHGVNKNCGVQRGYSSLMELLKTSTTGRFWDDIAKSPYFTYQASADKTTHQVWFDDVQSLPLKYKLADEFNLRGVGMWDADSLNYTDTPEMRKYVRDMWGSLP